MPTLYSLDSTSLTVQKNITLEELMRLGEQVATTGRLSMFHIGDWLLQVSELFPAAYEEAAQRTKMDYGMLRDAKWVSKAVPAVRRRESLSFYHHREVSGLEQDQQEKWLAIAEKEGASQKQLRAWIKHGKVITAKEAEKMAQQKLASKGKINLYDWAASGNTLIARDEAIRGQATTWSKEECINLLEALVPLLAFADRLSVGAGIPEEKVS